MTDKTSYELIEIAIEIERLLKERCDLIDETNCVLNIVNELIKVQQIKQSYIFKI